MKTEDNATKTKDGATKERPIIFSGKMVRAILEGRKTQTRRVIKPPLVAVDDMGTEVWVWQPNPEAMFISLDYTDWPQPIVRHCPYGKVGDRLWVRESMRENDEGIWVYAADDEWVGCDNADDSKMISWVHHVERTHCPSIHMPRWASRITLEVVNVRVERLQEISEADAKAEGVGTAVWPGLRGVNEMSAVSLGEPMQACYRNEFATLWDKINGDKYPWQSGPWVWVIEFRAVTT